MEAAEIAVAIATSDEGSSAAPPPTSPPLQDAASGEKDGMEVEEERASAQGAMVE